MTLTVLASVVLHGISAPLLVRAYAHAAERLPADAPELSAVEDAGPERGITRNG